MAGKEGMDVDAVLEQLGKALCLQYRSALEYTLVAGSLSGFEYAALGQRLWRFAEAEPPAQTEPFEWLPEPGEGFSTLIDHEQEAIGALQDVIPSTGKDGPSEALEHRMKHLIMRKQEQVDFLTRASRKA